MTTPQEDVAWALMLRRIGALYHPDIRPDGCDEANATVAIKTLRDGAFDRCRELSNDSLTHMPYLLPEELLCLIVAILGPDAVQPMPKKRDQK